MKNFDVIGVGNRIRTGRNKQNLTQEELARMVGITGRHLLDLEKGRRVMSIDILYNIAQALNVSSDWLLMCAENSDEKRD